MKRLNQGKESRQSKPPTSLSRTQLHSTKRSDGEKKKGWKLHFAKQQINRGYGVK
jgi:hypothetical protein